MQTVEAVPEYPATPELDKMERASVDMGSQYIGEFLEWINSQGWELAEWEDHSDKLNPISSSIKQILAYYCEIDLAKVDQERSQILKYIREKEDLN